MTDDETRSPNQGTNLEAHACIAVAKHCGHGRKSTREIGNSADFLDSWFLCSHEVSLTRASQLTGTHACRLRYDLTQAILISICFGFAFSLFGKCTVSKPFLNSAFTLVASASSGRVKLRTKVP
jgi:hypothetical protein